MQKVIISPVSISSTIEGTIVAPEVIKPNNPAILFIHGWRSNESGNIARAKALAEIGYLCLTFNLRGHGSSGGDIKNLTRQDFLNDTISAYNYLAGYEKVDSEKIGVIGSSFGGYLGAILTGKKPVRWLALRAPAMYADRGFENIPQVKISNTSETRDIRRKELNYSDTFALSAIHEYPHEILLIESENDEVVPHLTIQNYAIAVKYNSKLTEIVISGAEHKILTEKAKKAYIDILVNWFKDKI